MNYDQKLAIAKIAYRQVNQAIEELQSHSSLGIKFGKNGWDGIITVDGQEFRSHQLENHSED